MSDNAGHTNRWMDFGDVIHLILRQDALTSGEQWIGIMNENGKHVNEGAMEILRSGRIVPSLMDKDYEIALLKGSCFVDGYRNEETVCAEARKREFVIPNADMACLMHMQFSEAEVERMGFDWIVVMHDPIEISKDLGSFPHSFRLSVRRAEKPLCPYPRLGVDSAFSDRLWPSRVGFAFLVPTFRPKF